MAWTRWHYGPRHGRPMTIKDDLPKPNTVMPDDGAFVFTIGKSKELDRLLSGPPATREKSMPEIGGKALGGFVRESLADLKKQLDALKLDAAGAITELSSEIKNGNEGVKRIREETAAVKAAFAEILGNEHIETK